MLKLHALVSLAVLSLGCHSPVTQAELDAAELYFFPDFKYVDEPRFEFSAAERRLALDSYRDRGADTLFAFVIDRRGRVVQSRLLRTTVRSEYHESMKEHAEKLGFSEDDGERAYRSFYFPTRYRYNATFEWL